MKKKKYSFKEDPRVNYILKSFNYKRIIERARDRNWRKIEQTQLKLN